jgi:hypothetical protein
MEYWSVVYGNYEPPEVDSDWVSEELAKRRATKLNSTAGSSGMWEVRGPMEALNEETGAHLL